MNNSLDYVKMMVEGGLEKSAAEQVMKVIHNVMTSNFATKHDLEKMELKTQSEINELRSELKAFRSEMKSSFENLELKMTVKLGLMLVAAIGVMTTLHKLI